VTKALIFFICVCYYLFLNNFLVLIALVLMTNHKIWEDILMDINFHYFAVKSIAHYAGLNDADAQQIANYSQFVDDYSWSFHRKCLNIPQYIKESDELDLYAPSLFGNFLPNQTGFTDWLHFALLVVERNQRLVVSPFHLVPLSKEEAGNKNYRVVPAKFGDGSLIDSMLNDAIQRTEQHDIRLMRVGMLLHTFADTYAHQLFNGFNSWVNKVKVTKVVSNITNADITRAVLEEIRNVHTEILDKKDILPQINHSIAIEGIEDIVPPIAHAWAGHTPDLSHVSFEMEYKTKEGEKGYSEKYERNNTETFLECSRHILNYLRKCINKPIVSDKEWAEYMPRLQKGLLVEMPKRNKVSTLAKHWASVFSDIGYYYDKYDVEKRFYSVAKPPENHLEGVAAAKAYSDEFYEFNTTGNRLLVGMYEPRPRNN